MNAYYCGAVSSRSQIVYFLDLLKLYTKSIGITYLKQMFKYLLRFENRWILIMITNLVRFGFIYLNIKRYVLLTVQVLYYTKQCSKVKQSKPKRPD